MERPGNSFRGVPPYMHINPEFHWNRHLVVSDVSVLHCIASTG